MAQVVAQVGDHSGVQLRAETVLLGFTDEQRSRLRWPTTTTPSLDDDSSEQAL
ncbi:unannotated protein [freshwater metagenome]|uniref:Unannotated protein n=1 Tax=freshwater metagenome TaxID=449393 RepID=A0A6J6QU85_9ZZZZ